MEEKNQKAEHMKPESAGETTTVIKNELEESETTIWEKRMQAKKSLDIYRIEKRDITKENVFGNTKGSELLFEHWADCAWTKTLIREPVQEELCAGCGR